MDNRKMFQRRHYEAMSRGMAQMAQALENLEAQTLMSLSQRERDRVKAAMYAATLDTMCAVFEADNPCFNRSLFNADFTRHLSKVLHRIHLDKHPSLRYTIDDEASPIGWKEVEA